MPARGVYQWTNPASGAEYAKVDYGDSNDIPEIPRDLYEERGYEPPFDDLPLKAVYEARQAKKVKAKGPKP